MHGGSNWLKQADMTMTTIKPGPHRIRSLIAGCAVALAVLTVSASPLHAQSVAVLVNGEPITNLRYRAAHQAELPDHPQADAAAGSDRPADRRKGEDQGRQEIRRRSRRRATSINPTRPWARGCGSSSDQLTKSLESQGIRPDTLKARLKADMVWSSLVRGRFKESLQVGEKDVAAAAKEGGEQTQTEAFEYKMQPIILIVPKGAAPAAIELRKKEAEASARARPDLRGGQFLLQVDAERRDPRCRHKDVRRPPRPACANCSTRPRSVI